MKGAGELFNPSILLMLSLSRPNGRLRNTAPPLADEMMIASNGHMSQFMRRPRRDRRQLSASVVVGCAAICGTVYGADTGTGGIAPSKRLVSVYSAKPSPRREPPVRQKRLPRQRDTLPIGQMSVL